MPTTSTRERGILFSAPMILALQQDRKTMTRREVLPGNSTVLGYPSKSYWDGLQFDHAIVRGKSSMMVALVGTDAAPDDVHLSVPYRHPDDPKVWKIEQLARYRVRPKWEVGDVLWVRETFAEWMLFGGHDKNWKGEEHGWGNLIYKATHSAGMKPECEGFSRWKSGRFMPRWASRLTLEVESVKVEHLGDITEPDAIAEGVQYLIDDSRVIQPEALPPRTSRKPTAVEAFQHLWKSINGDWTPKTWVWCVQFRRINP